MIIDAIAELHPRNIFKAVLYGDRNRMSHYPAEVACNALLELEGLIPTIPDNIILEDSAWQAYREKLSSSCEVMTYYKKLQNSKTGEVCFKAEEFPCLDAIEFQNYLEAADSLLDIGRSIYLAEAKAILSGNYKTALLELDDHGFISNICKNSGIEVILLDFENPYYKELLSVNQNSSRYETLQAKREEVWVEKIKLGSKNSIIVAGRNHLNGRFGLAKKLSEINYSINTILSFENETENIDKGLDRLNDFTKKIMLKIIENSIALKVD